MDPPIPAKKPVDEFDDEFADLSEAKEADDKVDEDFGTASKSTFDEFNPVFDSPSSSRMNAQPPSSTFSNEAFRDFDSSISSSANTGKMPEQVPVTNNNHDWDVMFAGLDTPQNGGVQPSPSTSAFPSIPPVVQRHGVQQPALPPRDVQTTEPNRAMPNTALKPIPLERVPSMETEHDDPILKRLTGMGYSRQESLAALETYDYNIDKVGPRSRLTGELGTQIANVPPK